MGNLNCCCCKTAQVDFEKEVDDKAGQTSISPSNASTNQPLFESNQSGDGTVDAPMNINNNNNNNDKKQISEMLLCDENTDELCSISIKLIDILSIYHLFINNYNDENNADNICVIINDKLNEYNLQNLRNDYHHIITYHDSNNKFMKTLYNKLMELNNNNDITDLIEINNKLQTDQEKEFYFGHKMDDEISMIQTLNEIHNNFTYKYIHNNSTEIDDDNDPELDELNDDDQNRNIVNNENNENKNKIKKKSNKKNKKRGYIKSKTKDVDDDNDGDNDGDIEIDAKYGMDDKQKRKIGRLKLKKPSGKGEKGKYKTKNQKIINDDAWMNKKYKKRQKHIVTESIQMLGSTKLVSNNSFKDGLQTLSEDNDPFNIDLKDIDIDDLEMEMDMESYSNQRTPAMDKKNKTPSSMFDDNYEVDT